MKLLDDTIDLLSDASQPLANSFFKAQVIAHKLQDKQFEKWVRNEIKGYESEADVPAYRVVNLTPYGHVENRAKRYNNFKLPVSGMPQEVRSQYLVYRHTQSIAVIEGFARDSDKISISIDPIIYPFLMDGIDPSYSITSAWGKPPAGAFAQILNEARSRLLDLLLNLQSLLPEGDKETDVKLISKVQGLNDMFKGAVFGHGANISLAIGEGNQASHNKTSVALGDTKSLVSELKKHKVSKEDIAALRVAIKSDVKSAGPSPQSFGPGVSSWLGGMISKAGTPAWEIPSQVGAGLLIGALSKFFGMS
jgi:hypothetical protein